MPGQRGQTRATRAMCSLLPISMGNVYAPSRKRNKRRMHLVAYVLQISLNMHQPGNLQNATFQVQRQAAFDAVPLDPRSCPDPGVKPCTYRRWFSRPLGHICPVYWEVPMSTAKLQRISRFRMGSHLLPIEQGRHLRLPRHRRVCRLCHTGALGDDSSLMRGTCFWSALLLQISETSSLP